MAADVTSLVRLMNAADAKDAGDSTPPITRDLLGGCSTVVDSQELDLDLQVPSGWEKRLDLKSGKVYIQRCDSPNSSASENKPRHTDTTAKRQGLNFPSSSKPTLSLFNDSSLDLRLASPASTSPSSSNYQSVCTLDKVKSALERAEKESSRKRSRSMSKPSSPISNSSSSTKDGSNLDHEEKSSIPMATVCPCCSMYVLISKNNPKCPRCNSNVPLPALAKKPRIDLNISI